MRTALIGFAFGVAMLQQRSALPEPGEWIALAALFAVMAGIAVSVRGDRFRRQGSARAVGSRRPSPWAMRATPIAVPVALAAAAAVAGYSYAAMRAQWRLGEVLPLAWESRELTLEGYIRGLPVGDRGSVRFTFAVDVGEVQRRTGIERFPSIVQLSWNARGGACPPHLMPGDRWRLVVRLKRAHGHANFAGHDMEASLFERGIRATGSVVPRTGAIRLPGVAGGIGTTIDRLRFALRERIARALSDAKHRGIVTALAIGAQEAISADDRLALHRSGTSHLVAMKW
ncbi:MAG TPA: DUF4131 domain-containing protein [Trinickia sp.]|nr:DUF4131 domain-containing protein [Trinickia sp.]